MSPRGVGPVAIGLLALVCVQACASKGGVRFPQKNVMGITIEAHDPSLAAALLELRLRPSAASHRAVAAEYRRLRIDDQAFDHLTSAVRIDRKDAAAYDGRARIWRDWGFAEFGLADSARAVYYAPRSATAHNTQGTLLAATGQREAARRAFAAALANDPDASFAFENLCRLGFMEPAACAARTVARAGPGISVPDR